jgi:hypothetical protein
MPFDYSTAPPPRDLELIPPGTVATCILHLRPGGAGEGGLLKRSKDGGCEMLDCELVVADGLYKGRKFWEYFVVNGTTPGHAQAVDVSHGTLKAVLDSALGLKPDDMSPEARAARTVDYKDFEGKAFIGKIGVEKGKPKNDGSGESWSDKNILASVVTPDKKDWRPTEQPPPFNGGESSGGGGAAPPNTAPPVSRPRWAS